MDTFCHTQSFLDILTKFLSFLLEIQKVSTAIPIISKLAWKYYSLIFITWENIEKFDFLTVFMANIFIDFWNLSQGVENL